MCLGMRYVILRREHPAALQKGEVDAVYPSVYGEISPWARPFKQSFPVYRSTMVALCRDGVSSLDQIKTFVAPSDLFPSEYLHFYMPDRRCLIVPDRAACMQALHDGSADAVVMRRERLVRYLGYANEHDHVILDMPHPSTSRSP